MAAVARLNAQYPESPWRLKGLIAAANRYLLINRPDDYVPLYKAAYEAFPNRSVGRTVSLEGGVSGAISAIPPIPRRCSASIC